MMVLLFLLQIGTLMLQIKTFRLMRHTAHLEQKILLLLMPSPAARILFYTAGQEITQMQIHDNKTAALSLAVEDVKGNPTVLPAGTIPAWSVDDTSMGAVVASDDGMSAVFTPAGKLGTANITASAGSIAGSLPVDVIASDAAIFQLSGSEV